MHKLTITRLLLPLLFICPLIALAISFVIYPSLFNKYDPFQTILITSMISSGLTAVIVVLLN